MLRIIEGDLTVITRGIMTHQVNCMKRRGSGIALTIRNKFPKVYEEYQKEEWELGKIQLVKLNDNLYVCNLAGQYFYGREKRHTDYSAVNTGFCLLAKESKKLNLPVCVPYNMGCGLGGGDWDVYSKIIETHCPEAIVYKYD